MKPRSLKEWIQAMKLCKDNDIAFSVSGPGLLEFIDCLENASEKLERSKDK